MADRWLALLGVCLLGYALAGRGFAYLGVPPIYVGEMCLASGLFIWILTRSWSQILRVPTLMAVLPLMILGAWRLLPGISDYGVDAVRDAVIWGYALFAIIITSLIAADPQRLPRLIGYYGRFTKIFLLLIPVMFVAYRYFRFSLPQWPWANTSIIQVKEGDVLVHLSGVLAFWMADPKKNVRWIWVALLTLNMAAMGVIDRAGLVAFAAVMIICIIARPSHRAVWRTIALLLCGVVLLWGSAVKVEVPGGKGRTISWEQFVVNFASVFGESDRSTLQKNKQWRLDWWDTIVGYTINGPYFWTGKGFGINLADDDGFQVSDDHSLRSPHSIHMTMLARIGVPGAAAWAFMLAVMFYGLADAYFRSRRRGNERWAGVFLFLFAYFAAFVINGSFDVFIEGPMGGIWFWTIYGTSAGALWAYRRCPQVLADVTEHEDSRRAQLLPAAGRGRPGLPLGAGAAGIARA